jgi:hypothetical protein
MAHRGMDTADGRLLAMQIGTFFGIPVIIGHKLYLGDRCLGTVVSGDWLTKVFLLDDGKEPIELDQAH